MIKEPHGRWLNKQQARFIIEHMPLTSILNRYDFKDLQNTCLLEEVEREYQCCVLGSFNRPFELDIPAP